MFQPNSIVRSNVATSWHTPGPDSHVVVNVYRAVTQWIVTLYEVDATNTFTIPFEGTGQTVRDAYREADHQRRYARYTIEGLQRKRQKSVRRELAYRAKLKLTGMCLDQTIENYEDALDELRAELAATANEKMEVKTDLVQATARIRDLEFAGNEKDKGMALIRAAFEEVGITEGSLVERVKALAAERDQALLAARQNAAATAAS